MPTPPRLHNLSPSHRPRIASTPFPYRINLDIMLESSAWSMPDIALRTQTADHCRTQATTAVRNASQPTISACCLGPPGAATVLLSSSKHLEGSPSREPGGNEWLSRRRVAFSTLPLRAERSEKSRLTS